MSLNRKIGAILLVAITLILLSGWIVQVTIHRPLMRDLARREVEENATRCLGAIDRELGHLKSMARDWAHRRETYDFLESRNEQYRTEYLTSEILAENNFDMVLLVHDRRKLIWGMLRDRPLANLRGVDSVQALDRSFADLCHAEIVSGYEGVVSTAGGIMLISTERVAIGSNSPNNGLMILGRYFDDPILMKTLDTSRIHFALVPLSEHEAAEGEFQHEHISRSELEKLLARLETESRVIQEDDSGLMHGWELIRDHSGKASLLLHFRQTDADFGAARIFENQVWLARIATGLLVLLVIQLALKRVVLGPMGRLQEFVRRVRQDDDLSIRCTVQGSDEFVSLAAEMNRTLDSLQSARADLVQARDKAEAAAKAKSEFLGVMSHEIRTPLNGVIGMLGLLQESPLDTEQRECIEVAQLSANTLLSIINEILDFSKIEANKLDLEEHEFQLAQSTASTLESVQHQAEAKNLLLRGEVDPATPEALVGDPSRLRQILINLLNNAIKFTDAGQILLKISPLVVEHSVARLRFEVRDTGVGISPDHVGTLFEPFVQVDSSTTRRHGGTGLGLAICRRLVEQMNGSIGVDSEPGKGSTFWFELPFKLMEPVSDDQFDEENGKQADVVAPQRAATRQARILVAEDNSVNQKVIRRMLQKLGYYADIVGDGREALTALSEFPYDLVLMDCHMPEMDGFEATRRIRQLEAGTRRRMLIIALTADALLTVKQRCSEVGMDDFLSKPLTLPKLETTLAKYLGASLPAETMASASAA